jgi:hypothetical protein
VGLGRCRSGRQVSVLGFVVICLLGGVGRRVRWQDGWRGVRADGGGSIVDIGLGGSVYVDNVWGLRYQCVGRCARPVWSAMWLQLVPLGCARWFHWVLLV